MPSETGTLDDYFTPRKQPGETGLPVLSVTMNDGLVPRDSLDRRTESAMEAKAHSLVEPGDIAYNMMRMWQGASGLCHIRANISPAYVVMTPKANADPAFAAHWLKSKDAIDLLWAYSHGLTEDRLRLYADDFLSIPATFPLRAEQQRIAAILDRWDDAITAAERLSYALARRKRGIAFALFGDGHNPFAVDGSPLEDIATVAYGKGVAPADYRSDGDIWVIGTQGLMAFSTKAQQYGPVIIVGRKGTLNRPMYVPPDQGFAAIDTTFILRAVDPSRSRALFHYLRYINLAKLNEASGVPSVSADTLRSLPIPQLEGRQSDILDACDAQIGLAEGAVKSLREQKRGLMQQLLTGKLPVPKSIDALLKPSPEQVAAA